MPEIYVLKLCVVSFEGTSLPCGECSDFQNARAILSEASPVGAESPQEAVDLSNQGPICSWSKMGEHHQNSAPSEFPRHICSPNLTEIIPPPLPSLLTKQKREWEKGEQ